MATGRMPVAGSRRVLIIVQNLPVPLDRRVWLECQALIGAGIGVSVICPKGPGDPGYQMIDDVRIYKYRPAPATRGALSYLWEFVYCWVRTAWLSPRVWRRDGFAVIQACNPPDTYWALARLWRRRGVAFVYDQHDLNPEVFRSRFGEPATLIARAQYRALLWLERSTYRSTAEVISTNESYRGLAISRGRCPPQHVTVVRSGPNTAQMRPIQMVDELRAGSRHLLVYLGIMGPQDGVDIALRAMEILVHRDGRRDIHLALLGFGDSYDDLVALSFELGLADFVTFTGRADLPMIARYLSTAVIALGPDPSNPLNDVSTMNKTMEYMAFAVPVVTFDLPETRVSAGQTAAYVAPAAGVDGYARAIAELLDDPERRMAMAVAGRARVVAELDWAAQARKYVAVFERLLGVGTGQVDDSASPPVRPAGAGPSPWGLPYVDLDRPDVLRASLARRSHPIGQD